MVRTEEREGRQPGRAADRDVLTLETKAHTSLQTPTSDVFGDLLRRALRACFPAAFLLKHGFGGRLLIHIRLRKHVRAHLDLPLL